jgi:alpha-1,2-mannosyltransferase
MPTAVRRTITWVLFPLALALLLQATQELYHEPGSRMLDMEVYRTAVRAVLDGVDPYMVTSGSQELLFGYPPFSLLVLLPFGSPGLYTVAVAWTALSIAGLQAAIYVTLRGVGVRWALPIAMAATVPALLVQPVDQVLQSGQVSLALVALVVLDLRVPDGSRFKGVLSGLAAGLKIYPAAFVLYYALTGRRRAAGTLVATAAGTVVLGWVVFPAYSAEFWLDLAWETDRLAPIGWVDNESMRAMLARVMHSEDVTAPWLVASALAVVAGAVTVRAAHRIGEDGLGAVAVTLAMVLVSPVAWHHYWVWLVPMSILVGDAAWRRGSRLLWVCAVVPIAVLALRISVWVIPDPPYDPLTLDVVPVITTSICTYVAMLVLAGLCAWTSGHRDGTPAARTRSGAAADSGRVSR